MDTGAEISAVTELVACLEKATLMSKQLPNATDPSKITQIYATLHATHFHLSSFLAQSFQPPLPQPSLPPPPPPAGNCLSSAAADGTDDEPMQVVDEEEEFKAPVDRVEERMRDFFIQNKRLKRPLSPAAAAEAEDRRRRQREDEPELVRGSVGFDPLGTRSRSLDLIYQFHG